MKLAQLLLVFALTYAAALTDDPLRQREIPRPVPCCN
jgi:hypothetical protein